MALNGQTNQLLGYPADARLLIVNADDFGMCHAVNKAILGTLKEGIVRSTSLMVPCPWMLHATHFLADHPEIPCRGFPANDYDFLDSYSLDPVNKVALHAELLHELPVGLSEWAVHPGLDNSELLAIEPGGNHVRQTDFDFLTSQQAKDIVREEGIILLDYRALQAVWKK